MKHTAPMPNLDPVDGRKQTQEVNFKNYVVDTQSQPPSIDFSCSALHPASAAVRIYRRSGTVGVQCLEQENRQFFLLIKPS